jgi:hypothetical protein
VASACEAIEVIVHQGEGLSDVRWADPSHQELTHFHKYKSLVDGTMPPPKVPSACVNPKRADMPADLLPLIDLFNALYRLLLFTMADIFDGAVGRDRRVGDVYGIMSGLMRPVARYLMTCPLPSGDVAGPTFELYEFASLDPVAEVRDLARAVARAHPDLDIDAALASLSSP